MDPAYVEMLAFLGLFVVIRWPRRSLIQGFYHRTPAFEDKEWLDEIIGGVLGVIEVLLVVGMILIILDSYFLLERLLRRLRRVPRAAADLRGMDLAETASFYRDVLVPVFVALAGPFMPADIQRLYPR